jgi:polysaccharide biosynthesis PFTS motif protein
MLGALKSIFLSRASIFDFMTQLDDLVMAVRIHFRSSQSEIDIALFPNTVVVERPLWSIALERSGTKIVLVHYSASAEPLEIDSERIVDGIWNLSSWTHTWIVDTYQESQMRSISEFTADKFEVVGVPFWTGRKLDASFFIGGPWVSVFDTTIRSNLVFSASSIDDLGWNNSELEEEFIRIVLEAAVPLNLKILHKKKRRVSETNQLDFDRTARILKAEFGVFYTVVDENVAPESLIENSSFVVSKPISTIAFSAAQHGVPAIILDPTGNIRRDDPGLRNIPVARHSSELTAFFLSRTNH